MQKSRNTYRKSQQYLLPVRKEPGTFGRYDIYPTHPLEPHVIKEGFCSLADVMQHHQYVILEGYQGVFFETLKDELQNIFDARRITSSWIPVHKAMKTASEITSLVEPYLGGDDPLFGTRTTLTINSFFNPQKLSELRQEALSSQTDITILYGPGASQTNVNGLLVYADIPKNEIQFRSRAESISNLGADQPFGPKVMYKRFYFVEWPLLNRHKEQIMSQIDIFVDAQRAETITWARGKDIRDGIHNLSKNVFRVRPWFEPGVWGGNWSLQHIDGLSSDVPNYAWSFELITPENGLIFESSGLMLELSFDMLMFQEAPNVLGHAFERFGNNFPIRFDFLDTFDGGNLSVQVHPVPEYTKTHFNEDFTQEETYYILDAKDDAVVYLGFQNNINPEEFEDALHQSFAQNRALDIENYVTKIPAKKHDLFLIPPGTIHASGKNNLVLEISSTPYIFTFKLYDWVRPDLTGKPRQLNIERGMQNLNFERKGSYVQDNLISKPNLIKEGADWQLWHLPTHPNHFYDVHRIHLKTTAEIKTQNQAHVLSLVEGTAIIIKTASGQSMTLNYAETFVIPAAAQSYLIINQTHEEIKVIKAFVKT
jgi:mannose-6-phosphate isomerase class I